MRDAIVTSDTCTTSLIVLSASSTNHSATKNSSYYLLSYCDPFCHFYSIKDIHNGAHRQNQLTISCNPCIAKTRISFLYGPLSTLKSTIVVYWASLALVFSPFLHQVTQNYFHGFIASDFLAYKNLLDSVLRNETILNNFSLFLLMLQIW